MSFRDDMKEITKREIELVEHRTNTINEEEYELLYNYTFSIIKERLAGIIKNRYIHYDEGFFSKKSPRYEAYYGIRITVYPEKINDFYKGVYVYNKRDSSIYDGGWIHLQTAYLDDVKKSLEYLFNKSKLDKFDHILIDTHNSERYLRNGYTGKEFTIDDIDSIIANLKNQWDKNIDSNYTLYSCVDYLCDVIVQIECDWDGNIK